MVTISAKGNFETICHNFVHAIMSSCLDLCHSSVSSAQAGKNSNISEEDVIKLRSWGKHTRQVNSISITYLKIKTRLFLKHHYLELFHYCRLHFNHYYWELFLSSLQALVFLFSALLCTGDQKSCFECAQFFFGSSMNDDHRLNGV